ncbi:ABC transporter ATP-binding protein [Thalassospira marina]|uniref:ABC transmembrane type-1 domain-containing protein n=1 Tax=Thalassospira marina TaxID=2048283 RepID=A0A2N3KJQ3_9PROT|nr:ABC transporter ATP-binding protein [Thalassospira marina]AUG55037.1 hypothetical protein CSC3H3_09515 [Thalassospira marina]PKR50792.1 hypothetical protein COO20_20075 [Thalassospira marina]
MPIKMIRPRKPEKTGDPKPASSLWRYVWRMSGCHQIWVSLLAVVVAALSMLPIELQRRLVDDAISDGKLDLLLKLAGAYAAVLILHGLCKYALRLYQGWLSESSIRYNRLHLSQLHEEHEGEKAHEEDGKVVSIIGSEIDKLGGFVGECLSQPVVNTAMLVFGLGYMLTKAPLVAAIGLAALIPQVLLVPVVQKRINILIARRVNTMRRVGDDLTRLPHNDIDLKETDLPDRIDLLYRNRMMTFVLKFGMKAIINFLNGATPLIVLIVGGYLVIEGRTTIGIVVAFISGFDRLSDPMREMLSYYRVAAQANVQHKMIARWMK